jgi:MFS family permease
MLPRMNPRATLAATILGSSLAFIDGSVVNVALPALAQDLNVDPANLSWAINAYLLPLGALILLGGALGDHFGRRRLFQLGLRGGALARMAPGGPWAARIRSRLAVAEQPCHSRRRLRR